MKPFWFGLGGALIYAAVAIAFTAAAAIQVKDPTNEGAYVFSLFLSVPISLAGGFVFGFWLGTG